jgi:squalene-associated FAD-dependent desaturase
MTGRVVVVGGGLAGLAAATGLLRRGHEVTLVEARARLGGATFSFERDGLAVDNGQHVLLRCYTEYRAFLDVLGVGDRIDMQDRFHVPVLAADGRRAELRRNNLPAPLHLGATLAGYRLLGPADRARVLMAAAMLRTLNPADPRLDERSFADWLVAHGQRPKAIDALWDLITVAALNTDAAHASLALCAMVFRTALLERADAADIGVPTLPLGELHGDAAHRYLTGHGATVLMHTPVRAVRPVRDGFEVVLDGDTLAADAVVVAAPPEATAAVLPAGALDRPERLAELGAAPIVNVHVVYDRRVTTDPFTAVVGSPVQWVFDRTAIAGQPEGQYLAVSVSAAQRWIDTPTAGLREVFLPELASLFPAARSAGVDRFFVTRERRATFRQVPGSARLRPVARTTLPGCVLAGAWTATGWPDTMEGAVRSGNEAAGLVDAQLRAGGTRAASHSGWSGSRGEAGPSRSHVIGEAS